MKGVCVRLFRGDVSFDQYSIPILGEAQCVYVHRRRCDHAELSLEVKTISTW